MRINMYVRAIGIRKVLRNMVTGQAVLYCEEKYSDGKNLHSKENITSTKGKERRTEGSSYRRIRQRTRQRKRNMN